MKFAAEKERAHQLAGPGNEALLKAVAKQLHYSESLHMHTVIQSEDACGYCWLRAGSALWAQRQTGQHPVLTEHPLAPQQPVELDVELLRSLVHDSITTDPPPVYKGWRLVADLPAQTNQPTHHLIIRDEDGHHYAVDDDALYSTKTGTRIVCQPVQVHSVITETVEYRPVEPAAGGER